jgi:hypothetical protein
MLLLRLPKVELANYAIFAGDFLDILNARLNLKLTISLHLPQVIQSHSNFKSNTPHREHVRSSC